MQTTNEFQPEQTLSPIVREYSSREITIPLDAEIKDEVSYYRDCIELTKDATENDTIKVIINTNGGSLRAALAIINALELTEARTVAVIEGEASSAGSLIAMHCQEVEINPYSTIFIHAESFMSGGKRNEVKSQVEFSLGWVESIFRSSYRGFLTDQELDQVLDGKDIYLNAEDILNRFQARQQLLEQEYNPEGCSNNCKDCSCKDSPEDLEMLDDKDLFSPNGSILNTEELEILKTPLVSESNSKEKFNYVIGEELYEEGGEVDVIEILYSTLEDAVENLTALRRRGRSYYDLYKLVPIDIEQDS